MKEAELRKHSRCNLCGKPILNGGLPLFWRVTVERFGIDLAAVRRQTGLAMHLGNSALAGVMGADEDMAKPVSDPVTLTVCESCGIEKSLPVAALQEVA